VITGTHEIGNGCVLDFQSKVIELRGTLKGAPLGSSFSILAGSLTLNGGKLLSTGDGVESGGSVTVTVAGAFSMVGTGPRIDTGAGAGGGNVVIVADDVSISSGSIITDGGATLTCGSAGDVTLTARTGSVVLNGNATTISAATGGYDCAGGFVFVDGPSLDVRKSINGSGGNPPGISLVAATGDLVVRAGAVLAAGGRGQDADFGNDGGDIDLFAHLGAIDFEGGIDLGGSGADGGGGDLVLKAAETISIEGDIESIGAGTFASGGGVEITSGGLLTIAAKINVSGGGQGDGGFIDIVSGGVTLAAGEFLSADGGSFGGGSIDVRSTAAVSLSGDLLARGGNGGSGGFIDVRGCQLTFAATADADPGTNGSTGSIDLTGGSLSLTSTARLEARPCAGANCNTLTVRTGAPTIHPLAVLDPLPQVVLNPSLTPCCGNGTIEGPGHPLEVGEQCDDGNTSFCDGCSRFCMLEPTPSCAPDGNECTLDCSPTQGCNYKPQTNVPCSDEPGGNVCTLDVCVAGVCTHPPKGCGDGIACTVDTCDSVLGCQSAPSNARCNDGTSCTTEVCDPLNGEPASGCVYTAQPDGISCDDGDLCTTDDRCNGGACEPVGEPVSCEDGDPCTWNDCSRSLGCVNSEDPDLCPCRTAGVNAPAGTACADGSKCTEGDECNGLGQCTAGDFCPDDGDPCTREICYLGLCAHPDNLCPGTGTCIEGQPCSDGSACTTGVCVDGVCESDPIACGDGDPCTGAEGCHESLGCRQLSYPPVESSECSDVVVDAFACYRIRRSGGAAAFTPIEGLSVTDSFWSVAVDVKRPGALCLPLDVAGSDPEAVAHEDGLEALQTKAVPGSPKFTKRVGIEVTNVFGSLTLDAKRPDLHLVPTTGSVAGPPAAPVAPDPDAFACYSVTTSRGTSKFTPVPAVALEDRFGSYTVGLKKPTRLCTPADVGGANPGAPGHPQHLLCYQAHLVGTEPGYAIARDIFTQNALYSGKVDAVQLREICVPTEVAE